MEFQNDVALSSIWQMVSEIMRGKFKREESYQLWFGRVYLAYLDAERALFMCENKLKRDILEKQYREALTEALAEAIGYEPVVEIQVDESLAPEIPDDGSVVSPLKIVREREKEKAPEKEKSRRNTAEQLPLTAFSPSQAELKPAREKSTDTASVFTDAPDISEVEFAEFAESSDESRGERRLTYNEDYTFENFIVGNSNRFAHAAALNVADNVGMKINPLFIYGPSGLGKTHLMYAIANRALKRKPGMKVIYVKGEEFLNQLVLAIQRGWNQAFRQKYRSADMLLIDDIQFIAGKEGTQMEFFHTFDALYEDHKQIILTSDRPPKEIKTLEERLKSRFEWGLIADIQPPDLELRIAILRKKGLDMGVDIPIDVLNFLGENLRSNIRQIEGVIRRLGAYSNLAKRPITIDMARENIADVISGAEPVKVTQDKIFNAVARKYGVTVEDIRGKRRTREIAQARHVCIYIMRTVTEMSLPSIGRVFNRDHTTILSSIETIQAKIREDASLENDIDDLIKEITNQ